MGLSRRSRLSLIVLVGLLLSGMLACDFGGGGGAAKPRVIVASPESGIEVEVGEEVDIICIAEDSKGVVSIDLAVDGVLDATEHSPTAGGDQQWRLVKTWTANVAPGTHTLTITASNLDNVASDPAVIYVTVVAGATATSPPPGPTATPAPTNTPVPPPPPQPDLTIRSLTVDPANPALGASAAAHFTIRNDGNAEAGQSLLHYQWGPADREATQAQVPALAPGAEHPLDANVGPFHTSFSVWGMIDAGSVVTESNEDNNRREFTVNLALPDLTVAELSLNPFPDYGDESDVTITVTNIGSAEAGSFQVMYYWGATNACDWAMDPLPAGAEVTVSCHVGPFWGPFVTVALLDTGAEVTESDEDNNTYEMRVSATP